MLDDSLYGFHGIDSLFFGTGKNTANVDESSGVGYGYLKQPLIFCLVIIILKSRSAWLLSKKEGAIAILINRFLLERGFATRDFYKK